MNKERCIKEFELQLIKEQRIEVLGMDKLLSVKEKNGKPIVCCLIKPNQGSISFSVDFILVTDGNSFDKDSRFIGTLNLGGSIYHILTKGWYPGLLW